MADHLIKRKVLPKCLLRVAQCMRKCLFWIFNKEKKKEKKEDEEKPFIIKCNFCDRCEDCEKDFQKEKKKKKDKDELEINVSALNYLAFFILFVIILTCNLVIWLLITI